MLTSVIQNKVRGKREAFSRLKYLFTSFSYCPSHTHTHTHTITEKNFIDEKSLKNSKEYNKRNRLLRAIGKEINDLFNRVKFFERWKTCE